MIMKINALMCIYLIFGLTSCSAQPSAQSGKDQLQKHDVAMPIGDTVKELSKNIWIIFQDKNDNYWFGSDGEGVFRFDNKAIVRFTKKDGLRNDRIRGIQEDKSGNIFISTLEGIDRFDGKKFTGLPIIENSDWKLAAEDLWFSMPGKNGDNGPYRYDGKTLFHLKFPKHYLEDEFYARNGRRPWSPYEVYRIYRDSKGTMWFGTSGLGICRFDGMSLSWLYEKHLTDVPDGGSFGIRSIIEDRDGKFWFSNTNFRYTILPRLSDRNDSSLVRYHRQKSFDKPDTSGREKTIYYLSVVRGNDGALWMATYDQGVWRYDGKDIAHYNVGDGSQAITLNSIFKDNKGDLWLSSNDSGVFKFNGGAFQKFDPFNAMEDAGN